ncbi:Amino acid transporter avt6a [Stylosanthes scabra]|uniref:Amino acid transporter avt6a n=1 Tax=Stylosanthes scabra TaxID=79078 RepID=A0ABU6QJ57_9FABA|nr:Amino acid transporter avt6a [Stylosanthes scabra]
MYDNTSEQQKQLTILVIDEQTPLLLSETKTAGGHPEASFTGSVFNLSTTIIGAGIMALPATMKVLGLALGVAAIVVLALLAEYSLEVLMRFSKVGNAVTYSQVMEYAFGRVGRRLFQICIFVNNFGILVVYMIIIGDVLSGTWRSEIHHFGVLEGWFGEHWWTMRTFVLLMTTLFVLAPLAFFKHIDSLRYTSAIAVALAFVFLVILVGITFMKLFNGSITSPRLLPNIRDMNSIWNLFTAVPILVNGFVCHSNVHTINMELEDSSQIQPVVRASLVLSSIIYILTAIFGFLLFGESTLDDVLANFDIDLGIPYSSVLNDVVRISYAFHLMLVFPVIFFSLRFNFDEFISASSSSKSLNVLSSKFRFVSVTIGLVALVYIAANFMPSIWYALQFTGATATVCIGFVFPAAISIRDPHGIASNKDKILSIVMIVLAVFSNILAIYSNAASLLYGISE